MNQNERDANLLEMICEHCRRIEDACKRFGDCFEQFDADLDYQDAVNMNIFQIGELSNKLSDEAKAKYADVPWHEIYAVRNIMAHAYVQVDTSIIWKTVKNDIPQLLNLLI